MPSDLVAAFAHSDLGLRRGVVRLAPPSARWARVFEQAAAALRADAPASVVAVEHIGSTSVPGLPAKPILDVAIGVAPLADLDLVDAWLTGHGLLYRGERDVVRPDRMYGFEIEQMVRLCNVHVIPFGATEWTHYLGFRDRLRAREDDRDAYAALKNALADAYPGDRLAYIDGKADFIVARRG